MPYVSFVESAGADLRMGGGGGEVNPANKDPFKLMLEREQQARKPAGRGELAQPTFCFRLPDFGGLIPFGAPKEVVVRVCLAIGPSTASSISAQPAVDRSE